MQFFATVYNTVCGRDKGNQRCCVTLQELSVLSSQTESISVHSHHTAQLQTQPEGQVTTGSLTLAQRGTSVSRWIQLTVKPSANEEVSLHWSAEGVGREDKRRIQRVTHFQHMISHDAFGLDEDLVDHRVTMVTIHFMDAVLVKLG